MKKSVFFILVLLLFASANLGWAQESVPETVSFDEWDALRGEKGWTIIGYSGKDTDPVIPESFENMPVIRLESSLFRNNRTIQSVYIPDSVTTIGANVFYGCTALREVRLPGSLTKIESGTFRYCIELEKIDIPFTVTSVGSYAFADCIKLKEIILLSAASIGESAFDNCVSLSSVIPSRKATSVGVYAFRDTPWLEAQKDEFVFFGKDVLIKWNGTGSEVEVPFGTTAVMDVFENNRTIEKVILPDTVTVIGKNAFKEAVNLKQVTIPAFTVSIGANAFDGCESLSEIILPESITTLGGSAFRGCAGLKNIVIPSRVTAIPALFLADCPSLTSVIIPASASKIEKNAFQNSPKVKLLTVFESFGEKFAQNNNLPYLTVGEAEGDFVFSRSADGIRIIRYIGSLFDVEIPASIQGDWVTEIGPAAFQNNSRVRRVTVPTSVKSIGDWAFSYMPSLEYVQIPAGMKSIGSHVFTGSAELKEIKLPRRLQTIGEFPFDKDVETVICASATSEAELILRDMGYDVRENDSCSDSSAMLDGWGAMNSEAVPADTCVCPTEQMTEQINASETDIRLVRIPDDVTNLTADLLADSGSSLILVIPKTVVSIEEGILEGRILKIIADPDSPAAVFAAEHEIDFMASLTVGLK